MEQVASVLSSEIGKDKREAFLLDLSLRYQVSEVLQKPSLVLTQSDRKHKSICIFEYEEIFAFRNGLLTELRSDPELVLVRKEL